MAAYMIVDNEVTDSEGFREYQKRVGSTLESYGGTFLVRGGMYAHPGRRLALSSTDPPGVFQHGTGQALVLVRCVCTCKRHPPQDSTHAGHSGPGQLISHDNS
jgi:uncharacterized protein DUF1330